MKAATLALLAFGGTMAIQIENLSCLPRLMGPARRFRPPEPEGSLRHWSSLPLPIWQAETGARTHRHIGMRRG